MSLRRIMTGDMPKLAALHAESFARPWTAGELWDMAARPGAVGLLAAPEKGGALQGFVLCWRTLDEAEVLTLVVAQAARRSGVGSALLEKAVSLCGEEGAAIVSLEVAQDNTAALALYRRGGFEEVGRRKGYYRRPPPQTAIDALVLQRRLTAAAQPLILG